MQKKTKKNKIKPSYSAFSNVIWAIGMLIKNSPAAFIITVCLIPVYLIYRYLEIYIPALAVSEVTTGQTLRHAAMTLGTACLIMLVSFLIKRAFEFVKIGKLNIYRCKVSNLLTRKRLSMLYQTYEEKKVRDLGHRADMATWMWNGEQPLTDIVTNGLGIVENILGYILFGTIISFVSPWLILLLSAAPIVNFISVRVYNKWEYKHREKMTDLNQKLALVEELPDDFTAAKDIRIYSMASWLRECYIEIFSKRAQWDKKTISRSFASRIADLVIILIRDGGAYALLISMVLKGEITVDRFVLYFAAISSFASWIGGIIDCWNKIHSNSLKICDFRDYIDYPEQDGSGKAKAEEHLGKAPEIIFDKVCYRYDEAEEDTIHDLSFTLHSGEKLALVGLNGAGKTTIVKLLCGLYLPTSGCIKVNGIPVTDFTRDEYYKLISPVFQDINTTFFSLAETISGRSTKDTDIKRAEECMRAAGLGERLDSLPDGIHTKLNKRVNKNATELSGGEAQKLMLARAIYKDAPLLVLDEPTAALDPIAESKIYAEYNNMTKNKTALFVSHRLASTSFCDRIILIKNGSISEEGTHSDLMREGGEYKEMFDMQSCWYKDEAKGDAEI